MVVAAGGAVTNLGPRLSTVTPLDVSADRPDPGPVRSLTFVLVVPASKDSGASFFGVSRQTRASSLGRV